MGNYVMSVDLFGSPVRCETEGLRVCLNDLMLAGNAWRNQHKLPFKQLKDIVGTKSFSDFKEAVCRAKSITHEEAIVTTKGCKGRTMAHLYLAIYIAEQMSPEFHVKVISTFVEGKLLEFRDHGGSEFKTLNAAIDSFLPEREGNDNKGCFIQTAKLLREKILGDKADAGDWGNASVAQTHQRYEIENKLVSFLQVGVVKNWDHLKELIAKV